MICLFIILMAYLMPILIFVVIDYLRCPKGTTLGNFLCGRWFLTGVDRDDDDPYDSYLNFELIYIPLLNWLILIIEIVISMKKFTKGLKIWDVKIK